MANDKITLLRHLQLLAVRSAAFATSKVSELATSVTEALEELDESKLSIGDRADIPSGTDLNTLTTPGCYKAANVLLVNSLVNLPASFMDSNLFLDVYKSNDYGNICQRISSTSDAYIAVRVLNGTTWGEWDTSYSEAHKPTASELGVVPRTRTVNGKSLDSNITLTAADVGAASAEHTHDGLLTIEDVQTAVGEHDGDSWSHQDIRLEVENARVTASDKMSKDFSNATGTLPVAKGGTGATTAEDARTALGAAPAYQYGTTDLTAGSSALASGTLYFVYE